MIRIGWFSPISVKTGIASYTQGILEAMASTYPRSAVDVVVFHPATTERTVRLPYPTIELSNSLVQSDFDALFDMAVYHIGNNALNHQPIFEALERRPGVVVLHDQVYQHYLAGLHHGQRGIAQGFGALIQDAGGGKAFATLDAAGVLPADCGAARFVPWETEWATTVPLGDLFANLSFGAVVHSDYARRSLGDSYAGKVCKLFMPAAAIEGAAPPMQTATDRIRLTCAGHIQKTKGLQLLTAAFAAKPELRALYKVIIAGHPSDPLFLSTLRAEIEALDLEDTFEIILSPDEHRYSKIIGAADIHYNLRFPNTEGASLSLSEQLASGRPVIAYRTGSFAEVPEDACYFLDEIGQSAEVAALLARIASNRADIAKRGARARQISKGLSAKSYAESLVGFLKDNRKTFAAQAEALRSRAAGKVPSVTDRTAPWFTKFASTRPLVRAAQTGGYAIPRNLFASSAADVGRFVCLNQLQVRTDSEAMTRVGALLLALPRIRALEVMGLLYQLRPQATAQDDVDRVLLPVCLPVLNLDVWRVLLQLPAKAAVEMALRAISGTRADEHTERLIRTAETEGNAAALSTYLSEQNFWGERFFAPVREMLAQQRLGYLRNMPAYLPPTNILSMLHDPEQSRSLAMIGFNTPEADGIWTQTTSAQIYLSASVALKRIELTYDLLELHEASAGLVSVSLTALDSGLSVRFHNQLRETKLAGNRFTHELPSVSGLLCIEIETHKIINLRAKGISADGRDLGLMIKSLSLGG